MIRTLIATCVAAVVCVLPGSVAHAGDGEPDGPDTPGLPPTMLGPGDAQVSDIKDKALIRTSEFGYVYIAGQQASRLTVTYVEETDSLRYRDYGTKTLTTYPKACAPETVTRGISVVCAIPDKFADTEMFVQVWPRLGNDLVNGRALPERFRLWALVDAGRDEVRCGVGDCFVNGAFGNDKILGGTGDDWLRAGPGKDVVDGGGGTDRIVR